MTSKNGKKKQGKGKREKRKKARKVREARGLSSANLREKTNKGQWAVGRKSLALGFRHVPSQLTLHKQVSVISIQLTRVYIKERNISFSRQLGLLRQKQI